MTNSIANRIIVNRARNRLVAGVTDKPQRVWPYNTAVVSLVALSALAGWLL